MCNSNSYTYIEITDVIILYIIGSIDNFLRPLLNQNSNLPVLLSLFGLVGGVLAFGLIGLFLGPTLLAVAYNLFLEWVAVELYERVQAASGLPADAATTPEN